MPPRVVLQGGFKLSKYSAEAVSRRVVEADEGSLGLSATPEPTASSPSKSKPSASSSSPSSSIKNSPKKRPITSIKFIAPKEGVQVKKTRTLLKKCGDISATEDILARTDPLLEQRKSKRGRDLPAAKSKITKNSRQRRAKNEPSQVLPIPELPAELLILAKPFEDPICFEDEDDHHKGEVATIDSCPLQVLPEDAISDEDEDVLSAIDLQFLPSPDLDLTRTAPVSMPSTSTMIERLPSKNVFFADLSPQLQETAALLAATMPAHREPPASATDGTEFVAGSCSRHAEIKFSRNPRLSVKESLMAFRARYPHCGMRASLQPFTQFFVDFEQEFSLRLTLAENH